jgi:hydroxymethylpyrimidine/phosphomethylpyrimidine kinase
MATDLLTAPQVPAVLTIAGSDSGGGAGLQADLKVFHTMSCFGTSVVTCVTAQNPDSVLAVESMPVAIVVEQLKAIFDGFPIVAAKTGMLFSAEIIEVVAEAVAERRLEKLVVDPVMIATSGARLLREDAIAALRDKLIPLARVITPNLPEAEVLAECTIDSEDSARDAVKKIADDFGVACVLKGGHLASADVVIDLLYDGYELQSFETPRLAVLETHGTGCTFSAALAAEMAKGGNLQESVLVAQTFVASALANAIRVGSHTPLRV